jgi:anaerobic ribonucleoside-triphosphate reductase
MSTTKEKREKEEVTKVTPPSTTSNNTISSSSSSSQIQQEEEQRYAVNRALDETKDNIRKTTDEARRDIPRYTQAVNEYHEQTIQAARDIADNYLESQKEIINSVQSAWLPQIEAVNRAFVSSWMSPRHFVDNYARVVSSFADNTIAATRLVNNAIFANLEGFKTSVQNTRDNAKEFSRIGVNAAKTLEQTSRDTSRLSDYGTSYSFA